MAPAKSLPKARWKEMPGNWYRLGSQEDMGASFKCIPELLSSQESDCLSGLCFLMGEASMM